MLVRAVASGMVGVAVGCLLNHDGAEAQTCILVGAAVTGVTTALINWAARNDNETPPDKDPVSRAPAEPSAPAVEAKEKPIGKPGQASAGNAPIVRDATVTRQDTDQTEPRIYTGKIDHIFTPMRCGHPEHKDGLCSEFIQPGETEASEQ